MRKEGLREKRDLMQGRVGLAANPRGIKPNSWPLPP